MGLMEHFEPDSIMFNLSQFKLIVAPHILHLLPYRKIGLELPWIGFGLVSEFFIKTFDIYKLFGFDDPLQITEVQFNDIYEQNDIISKFLQQIIESDVSSKKKF